MDKKYHFTGIKIGSYFIHESTPRMLNRESKEYQRDGVVGSGHEI